VLARAGARVILLDRAHFPRDKFCGDTVNPGTRAALRRLGVEAAVTCGGVTLQGMRLTGPRGASVEGRYPRGAAGISISRRVFDDRMVEAAVGAGAAFEAGVKVEAPLVEAADSSANAAAIRGVRGRTASGACEWRAPVTIAADGRTSVLASALGLSHRPAFPARWAIGAYFEEVAGVGSVGEMHVRAGHYLGVAPLPHGLTNTILVIPLAGARASETPLRELLSRTLASDGQLGPRFASARPVSPLSVLGPMAVDVQPPGGEGLLLAGDAAGFIDPMTGDGMRFAVAGGELAAHAALEALTDGWQDVHERHRARRRQAFGRKQRFNRVMRRLTSSTTAVRALDAGAPLLRAFFSRLITYAGDVERER
jgi:flavin-dependent dehydrogenase